MPLLRTARRSFPFVERVFVRAVRSHWDIENPRAGCSTPASTRGPTGRAPDTGHRTWKPCATWPSTRSVAPRIPKASSPVPNPQGGTPTTWRGPSVTPHETVQAIPLAIPLFTATRLAASLTTVKAHFLNAGAPPLPLTRTPKLYTCRMKADTLDEYDTPVSDSDSEAPLSAIKRRRLGWYLVAFANSILVLNGGLYFTQWIVVDQHLSDAWFNVALVLVSLALIATAPFFGALSDRSKNKVRPLRWTSVGMFSGAIGIYALTKLSLSTVDKGIVGVILLSITLYSYQLGMVFVNSLLGDLSHPDRYLETSGFGLAADWIGGVFGLVAVYPFVAGYVPGVAEAGRSAAFLPSALLFALVCGSGLILLGGAARAQPLGPRLRVVEVYVDAWKTWNDIFSRRRLWLFLAAFLFFGDAILTIQNNAAIYLNEVMHFGDSAKALLFLLLLVMAAGGGIGSSRLVSNTRVARALVRVLFGWAAVLTAVAFVTSQWLFVGLFAVIGILFGMTWNLSRVLFISMISGRERGQYFGAYAVFERVSTIVGPLVWSVPFLIGHVQVAERYRIAMLLMAGLVALSIPLARRVEVASD